jgi:hypothetical protein
MPSSLEANKPVCPNGNVMRELDQRGMAALEFCLVAVAFFTLMFAIFDLGRYAITMQSLRALASAGARTIMVNDCYVTYVIQKKSPTGCPTDPLSLDQKQNVAPFLYYGGLTPTLSMPASSTSPLTITASQPGFRMMMPIWGKLNPSASAPLSAYAQIPF